MHNYLLVAKIKAMYKSYDHFVKVMSSYTAEIGAYATTNEHLSSINIIYTQNQHKQPHATYDNPTLYELV